MQAARRARSLLLSAPSLCGGSSACLAAPCRGDQLGHALGACRIQRFRCDSSSDDSSLTDMLQRPGVVLVDVRTKVELMREQCPGALHIPIQEVVERLDEFPDDFDTPLVVYCSKGSRSAECKRFLEHIGYSQVVNGINVQRVLAAMPEKDNAHGLKAESSE